MSGEFSDLQRCLGFEGPCPKHLQRGLEMKSVMPKIRDWANQNSSLVSIVAVLLIVGALTYLIVSSGRKGPKFEGRYYYDLNTDKLFRVKTDEYAPINAPSGPLGDGQPAGVLAYVFTCGECDPDLDRKTPEDLAAAGMFVGYLETYTPEAKKQLSEAQGDAAGGVSGKMVRTLDYDTWFDAYSMQGIQIQSVIRGACPRGPGKACMPGA